MEWRARIAPALQQPEHRLGGLHAPRLDVPLQQVPDEFVGGVPGLCQKQDAGVRKRPRALAAGLVLVILKEPRRVAEGAGDISWECSNKRNMAAQASLRGVVLRATTARETHRATH